MRRLDPATTSVADYLALQESKDLLRFITCGSVDDGKSTLIGRLLYEAKMLFETHETVIEIHGGFEAPRILGHPEDLNTAAVNLFNNSIYWLEQSKTANPKIDVWIKRQGKELVIYVDDNGPGIPEEFVDRVFDVGFTLKDGGTGLGLNIAYETLKRSDGTLSLHPEFKGGARFEIRFKL
jgi:signal transduction histidine kinase